MYDSTTAKYTIGDFYSYIFGIISLTFNNIMITQFKSGIFDYTITNK